MLKQDAKKRFGIKTKKKQKNIVAFIIVKAKKTSKKIKGHRILKSPKSSLLKKINGKDINKKYEKDKLKIKTKALIKDEIIDTRTR